MWRLAHDPRMKGSVPPVGRAGNSVTPYDTGRSMVDLVDIAIPADAQVAAEALGLKVHRNVTSGARVRQIPRDEAEIAIDCLRDWGITARIVEPAPRS